jgi:hypothetical protein
MAQILRDRGFHYTLGSLPVWHSEACSTLNIAIDHYNIDLVRPLLDAGLPINYNLKYFRYSRTPLQRAVGKGDPAILRLLLDVGANINCWPRHYRPKTAFVVLIAPFFFLNSSVS